MSIELRYFYGDECEQFTFYRIPKALFTNAYFKSISVEAKVLYGLLLDRMSLSARNGWLDDDGRVFIMFTIEEIMDALGCADQKVGKLLSELENKCGIIERKRQGLGKPNRIYVKNFIVSPESRFKKRENHDSGKVIITNQESLNSRSNNTDINNTEFSDTEIISYQSLREYDEDDTMGWIEKRKYFEAQIKENIEYDFLCGSYDKSWLDEIVAIMVDVVCSDATYIRINRQDFPHKTVKERFLSINATHIEYIQSALENNTSNVRNIRAFLITTIYRAYETAGSWFAARVNHDLYHNSG